MLDKHVTIPLGTVPMESLQIILFPKHPSIFVLLQSPSKKIEEGQKNHISVDGENLEKQDTPPKDSSVSLWKMEVDKSESCISSFPIDRPVF